jgi:hypothetical protein
MNSWKLTLASLAALCLTANAFAGQITGEYIEARTCDVYTGPCFANGEVNSSGKEAVLAWKVDEGSWNGVDLTGLGVALIVNGSDTLGFGGTFFINVDRVRAIAVVDERADAKQRAALIDFVKANASHLTKEIIKVEAAPITLTNDHLSSKGLLKVGTLANIETRGLGKGDCVCTNEAVFYPPLVKVENSHPAYTLNMSFSGKGLDNTWTNINQRGAFLATFSK